jgi:hypothetical protein
MSVKYLSSESKEGDVASLRVSSSFYVAPQLIELHPRNLLRLQYFEVVHLIIMFLEHFQLFDASFCILHWIKGFLR